MNIETLITHLHKQLTATENISRTQVEEWRKQYPYFSLPLLLYTQNNHQNDGEALSLSTIYVGDLNEWAVKLGISPNFDSIYPDTQPTQADTTDSAIDLFLHTYGKEEDIIELSYTTPCHEDDTANILQESEKPQDKEDDVLSSLITIPAYDYMSELEAMPDMENNEPMQDDDLLTKFINADAAGEQLFSKPEFTANTATTATQESAIDENESLFSESLAKIYIQQRRYAKALEIIRKLSLNNPEKNIYFADQIRFLEKLIINVKN